MKGKSEHSNMPNKISFFCKKNNSHFSRLDTFQVSHRIHYVPKNRHDIKNNSTIGIPYNNNKNFLKNNDTKDFNNEIFLTATTTSNSSITTTTTTTLWISIESRRMRLAVDMCCLFCFCIIFLRDEEGEKSFEELFPRKTFRLNSDPDIWKKGETFS